MRLKCEPSSELDAVRKFHKEDGTKARTPARLNLHYSQKTTLRDWG